MPGERVLFDGVARNLFAAFVGHGRHHQHFDAFYSQQLGRIGGHDAGWLVVEEGGIFVLSFCDHIRIERCLKDGRGTGYSPPFMAIDSCRDVVMRNSVAISGFNGPRIINSGPVAVEHSVFVQNLIRHLYISTHSDQAVTLANNIFTDNLSSKRGVPILTVGRLAALREENNCFYFRHPPEEKRVFTFYNDEAFDRERVAFLMGERREEYPVLEDILNLTLAESVEWLGETDSILANPGFPILEEFPLENGEGNPLHPADRIRGRPAEYPVDFNSFFATTPEVLERGMGLIPADFDDFRFDD